MNFNALMVLNIITFIPLLVHAIQSEKLITAQREYIEALEESEKLKDEYINLLEGLKPENRK